MQTLKWEVREHVLQPLISKYKGVTPWPWMTPADRKKEVGIAGETASGQPDTPLVRQLPDLPAYTTG